MVSKPIIYYAAAITLALAGCNQLESRQYQKILQSIQQGDENTAIQLLQSVDNVDYDYGDGNGITPLQIAAGHNLYKVSAYLIQRSANTGIEDNLGAQPIHVAASKGYLIIVKQLIDSGVDINVKTADGMSPLLFASTRCDKAMVSYLLSKNADARVGREGTDVILFAESTMNSAEQAGQNEKVRVCKEVVDMLAPHTALADPKLHLSDN